MPREPWRVLRSDRVVSCNVFAVRRDLSRSGDREHAFFVLECGDWVNVVPLTPEGEVVLVRQWRAGSGEVTLEIPGGMVDPGETPADAARRELLEETGYAAAAVEPLGAISPNPAILGNACHTFVARGVRWVGEPKGDGMEDIQEVVRVPLAEIPARIAGGEITHALVVVAFVWLLGLAPPPG